MINTMHSEEINKLSLRQMKNLILTVILFSLFFASQAFAVGVKNLDGLKKDISVISKILESSTELEGSRSKVRVTGDYFAKQGIVLKIRFPGSNHFNFSDYRSFPVMPDSSELFSSSEEIEALVADSMQFADLARLAPEPPEVPMADFPFGNHESKQSAKLREQQRKLHTQQRELHKKARKLEKEARKNETTKQTKEYKKLAADLKIMSKKLKVQSKEMKEQMLAMKKDARDKRQKKLVIWSNNLLSNFCSYAPYPRNLPRDEYLTLVLSNVTYAGNKTQDKVIVVNNNQLNACRDGKINGKELLAKSVNYSF